MDTDELDQKLPPELRTRQRLRLSSAGARTIAERELYRAGYVPLKLRGIRLFIGPHGHVRAVLAKSSPGRAIVPGQLRQLRGLAQGARSEVWNPRDGFVPIKHLEVRNNGKAYVRALSHDEPNGGL